MRRLPLSRCSGGTGGQRTIAYTSRRYAPGGKFLESYLTFGVGSLIGRSPTDTLQETNAGCATSQPC